MNSIEEYKRKIIEIFEPRSIRKNWIIRWAFNEIRDETEYLILGINPSNSYKMFKEMIDEFRNDNNYITRFAGLHEVLEDLQSGNSKQSNQSKYDEFLSDKNNESYITQLQELAHIYHKHFKKHKYFANKLKLKNKYQFFDLFPIWEIKQENLLNKMKNEKEESINAFVGLVDRHPNLKGLFFFNAGAGKFFMKERKADWDLIERVDVRELNDNKGSRISIVKKGSINLINRDIDVFSFGIGGHWNNAQLDKLAKKSMKYLSN